MYFFGTFSLPCGLCYRDFEVSETLHYLRADVFVSILDLYCYCLKIRDQFQQYDFLDRCFRFEILLRLLVTSRLMFLHQHYFKFRQYFVLYVSDDISCIFHRISPYFAAKISFPCRVLFKLGPQHLIRVHFFVFFSYNRFFSRQRWWLSAYSILSNRWVCLHIQRALKMFNS